MYFHDNENTLKEDSCSNNLEFKNIDRLPAEACDLLGQDPHFMGTNEEVAHETSDLKSTDDSSSNGYTLEEHSYKRSSQNLISLIETKPDLCEIKGRKSIHKESNKETSNLQDDPTSIQETSLKFLRNAKFFAVLISVFMIYIYLPSYEDWQNQARKRVSSIRPTRSSFLQEMKNKYPSQFHDEYDLFVKTVYYTKNSIDLNSQNIPYLLFHHKTGSTANSIAKDLGEFAASLFYGSRDIFLLPGSHINSAYFPNNFRILKERMSQTGTLIVTDFDKVESGMVRYFHPICDKYTPFIPNKAVIILVFETKAADLVTKDTYKEWKKSLSEAMRSLWSDLPEPILSPLITRLTENVIKINPEGRRDDL